MMSAGKVMASMFWDAEGVLLVDYLDKGHTFTEAYYADLLRQLRDDNAPAHRSTVDMTAIQKCGFQLVKDPPYSPDLARFEYYFLPKTGAWWSSFCRR